MNIRQCYIVLELPMRSPLNEVKSSYKDLVQVWHPDRFTHSPRLQEKAAIKLQLLNEAYDTLKNHLERQSVQGVYGYGQADRSAYRSSAYRSSAYRSPEYSSTEYGSTGATTTQAEEAGAGATVDGYPDGASSNPSSKAKAKASNQIPSFFDSGSSYSWKWQLQATGLIFGFIGLMLLPIGLAVLIAEHPLLILLLMPLPIMAYVYRVWVTR